MSKTILANVDGFTIVLDDIVEEYGLITAVVWGIVWRYCQMKDGVCKASQQTLSDKIGLSRRTIIRSLNILVKDGYFTAKVIHGIGVEYADTGKAGMSMYSRGGIIKSTCYTNAQVNNEPVTQSHTGCDTESQEGVTQSHTRKTLLRDSLREEEETRNNNELVTIPLQNPPPPLSNIFQLYESEIGIITPKIADDLKDIESMYPKEWIEKAIHEAVINNKRSLAYSMAILKRWKVEGFGTKTNGKNGNLDSAREAARQQMLREEAETRKYIEEVRIGTAI